MLAGPSLKMYRELEGKYPRLNVIASGGISSMQDIEDLNDINVPAAIVGKAIYEGHITLDQIREFNKSNAPTEESVENTDNK